MKQKGKQPYLSKREWRLLIVILAAAALGIAIFFIVSAALDDSLPMKDGAVVTGADNWIVVNEGSSSNPKFYQYAAYDFAPLGAEVELTEASRAENSTGITLRRADAAYEYAYLYGNKNDYATISESVHKQMGALLQNGEVHDIKPFALGERTGNVYWYTNWAVVLDEDGIPIHDENGAEIIEYNQTFNCYMPTTRGTIVARVVYKGADESVYVEPDDGYAELRAVLDCVTFK
ncbi:MAG: hypothetical protein ACOYI5_02130 [Christensenellales bacterium]